MRVATLTKGQPDMADMADTFEEIQVDPEPVVKAASAKNGSAKVDTPSKGIIKDGFLDDEVAIHDFDVYAHSPERAVLRAGGAVFSDEVQRIEAEKIRAKVEGREPDLENPPAIAGTPLRVPNEVLDRLGVKYNTV